MSRLILPFLLVFFTINIRAQGTLHIDLRDLNGASTTIAETAQTDLVVLDFWATWCKPCIKSIPKLIELSEKFDNEQISFIGINEDSPRNTNKVKPTVNSLKISYPVLLDPNQDIMTDLLINSLPTLVVINQKGKVLFFHEGYVSGDEKLIEEELKKLLAEHEK